MISDKLFHIFLSWGYLLSPKHLPIFSKYMDKMLKRRRVLIIKDNEETIAIITFFITNDYKKLYKKNEWACPQDEPNGKQIYIDKLVCKKYTLDLRRQLQKLFEDTFHWANEVHYHRAPFDRHVMITRRMKCQNTVSKS